MQAARQVATPLAAGGAHCGQAARMRLRCEGGVPRGGQPGAGDTPSEQQRAAGCLQSELRGGPMTHGMTHVATTVRPTRSNELVVPFIV
jgi:hypothetical protein